MVLRCLQMTALICRMDERSKTCRLASETVKEIFVEKIRKEKTRVKKNDFVIKKKGADFFLFWGKVTFFYYQTVILSLLLHCLLVLISLKPARNFSFGLTQADLLVGQLRRD